MRILALFATLLAFGCTAVQKQKAQPPRPDDLHFRNLQVLPPNISRDELIGTMEGFAESLGVRCGHCHVQIAETPKPEFDFPADVKPTKHAARIMIRMTKTINRDYVSKVEEMYTTVSCWTCHRGEKRPDVKPSELLEPEP